MEKTLAIITAIVLVCLSLPLGISAAGLDVVYVKDGGSGNGSTPEKACGSIADAFGMLELSHDCTVVVCGAFTIGATYSYGSDYTGSVTFTSLYNGTDYRTEGAVMKVTARFVCWGKTTWKDVNMDLTGKFYYVIGQLHPITLDTGVVITNSGGGLNGNSMGSSVVMLGGHQNNQDAPAAVQTGEANITVRSGQYILIVPFGRQIAGSDYSACTANITIENADVQTLYLCNVNVTGSTDGDINITIKGNSRIGRMIGALNSDQIVKSLTVNWEGGSIEAASIKDGTAAGFESAGEMVFTNGTKLNYSETAAKEANFETVKALFDSSAAISAATTTAPAVTTAAAVVTTAAPAATTAAASGASGSPVTADRTAVIIAISAAVAACAAVIVGKRTKHSGN